MPKTQLAVVLLFMLACASHSSDAHEKKLLPKQAAAKAALDREVKAEAARPCRGATNQRDAFECQGRVMEQTERDYEDFYGDLKSLLGRDDHGLESSTHLWLNYRKSACDAVEAFYRPGTYATRAYGDCMVQQTRSRMRDLDAMYATVLHD